jgi:hypothetical protein
MVAILTPGYLKWDGLKFLTDPGGSGPTGPTGDTGPAGSGIDGGFSATLYVDGYNGDDNTAVRGSLGYRYKTISAALLDAQSGDRVEIGSGTYLERIFIPNINTLAITGHGVDITVINGTNIDSEPSLILTDGYLNNRKLTIENLTILDTNFQTIDITTNPDMDTVAINNCKFISDSNVSGAIQGCYNVKLNNIYVEQFSLLQCVNTVINDCILDGSLSINIDPDNTYPTGAGAFYTYIYGTKTGIFTLSNLAKVYAYNSNFGKTTAAFTQRIILGSPTSGYLESSSKHTSVKITCTTTYENFEYCASLRGAICDSLELVHANVEDGYIITADTYGMTCPLITLNTETYTNAPLVSYIGSEDSLAITLLNTLDSMGLIKKSLPA